MSRPKRNWWTTYWVGAALLCAGLAWIGHVLLAFERDTFAARAEAEREESVRLALWRMDSWIAPLLARESARPYFEYLAFVPQDRAYTRLLNRVQPGEVYSPSPLLTFDSPFFPLHFQIDRQGTWSSPQVPEGNQLDLAQGGIVRSESVEEKRVVLREVRERLPIEVAVQQMGSVAADWNRALLELPGATHDDAWLVQACSNVAQWAAVEGEGAPPEGEDVAANDYTQRVLQNFNAGNNLKQDPKELRKLGPEWIQSQVAAPVLEPPGGARLELGPFLPVWIPETGPEDPAQLCFLRNVSVGATTFVQGFAAHWPSLRDSLLDEVADLFPGCEPDLVPRVARDAESGRRLAAVPAELVIGDPLASAPRGLTPARGTVGALWVAAFASLLGIGLSLRAGLAYAERRARFASSVTHELRTPLTTFRMYTEMLAQDVVTDPDVRREYLETLQAESDRLAVLVENVLAWARLEDGRTRPARESVPLAELAERHADALARRAREAGGALRVDVIAPPGARVTTDVAAVGQILFNLVDNACKYGRGPDGPRVELEATVGGPNAVVRVRDEGPGVPEAVRERVFRPFDRGRVRPEDENPGVGLGLALCRGLARDLGGDLVLEPSASGACFRLELPLDAPR